MAEKTDYAQIIESRRYPGKELMSSARFLVILFAIFALFIFIFTNVLIGVQVNGSSMEPTLYGGKMTASGRYYGGDYLFVNALATPDYGDIIVFHATSEISDNSELIKRVIGLPGDTIYAENGVLYRKHAGESDYRKVEEPYLGEAWTQTLEEYTVPEGEVYVLGDHRSVSRDSREFGSIPLKSVVGVVMGWSLRHKDVLTEIFEVLHRIRGWFEIG